MLTRPFAAVGLQGSTIAVSSGSDSVLGAIDTGTTLIGAPPAFVAQYYAGIDGATAGTGEWDGFYLYPCSTAVNFTLSFTGGARSWPVSDDDFRLQQVDDTFCAGALFDIDTGGAGSATPSWIVGDTFLKNVYSVFRASPASVGFATLASSGDAAGSEVLGSDGATAMRAAPPVHSLWIATRIDALSRSFRPVQIIH